MASQATNGTSRLAQMQMRFQQRQQQEKEQRRIELSGSGGSSINETDIARNSLTTAKTSNIGNGKVRQMFDERRRGAGIDRSNPLKPIKPMSSSSKAISTPVLVAPHSNKSTNNKVYGVRSQDQISLKTNSVAATRKQLAGGHQVSKQVGNSVSSRSSRSERINEQNNNLAFNKGIDDFDGEVMSKSFGDSIKNDKNNNSNGHSNKKSTHNGNTTPNMTTTTKTPTIKLNPVLTKKSPPARQALGTASSKRQSNGTTQSVKSESISSARSTTSKTKSVKSPTTSARLMAGSPGPSLPKDSPPSGMASCRICGRHFNEDRIAKHEQVCAKMANTKRKIFDASKHRVKGTEAEQFHRKKPNTRLNQRSSIYISAAAASGQTIPAKKNNWRQKHEEFITAIRAAKQVQAHLARGGKLSDLPPPPPSENPDYIQCPHCLRRFNETAAERHIPRCATMLHNKPKPGAGNQPQPPRRR